MYVGGNVDISLDGLIVVVNGRVVEGGIAGYRVGSCVRKNGA